MLPAVLPNWPNNHVRHTAKSGKNNTVNALERCWLGWQDSNLRMAVPKTAALPLGYTPMPWGRCIALHFFERKAPDCIKVCPLRMFSPRRHFQLARRRVVRFREPRQTCTDHALRSFFTSQSPRFQFHIEPAAPLGTRWKTEITANPTRLCGPFQDRPETVFPLAPSCSPPRDPQRGHGPFSFFSGRSCGVKKAVLHSRHISDGIASLFPTS